MTTYISVKYDGAAKRAVELLLKAFINANIDFKVYNYTTEKGKIVDIDWDWCEGETEKTQTEDLLFRIRETRKFSQDKVA